MSIQFFGERNLQVVVFLRSEFSGINQTIMRYHVYQEFEEYSLIQRHIIMIFGGKFFEIIDVATQGKGIVGVLQIVEKDINLLFFRLLGIKRSKDSYNN